MRESNVVCGKYISFVDSDDYIEEDFIETLYRKIIAGDYDVAISNAILVDDAKERRFNNLLESEELTGQEAMKKVLMGRYFQTVCWGKLYKAEIVKKVKFDTQMKIAEDLEFLLRIFESSSKIILTPFYKYYYIIRNNSMVRTISTKTFEEFQYCEKLIEQYKNTEIEKYAIKHYVNVNISYALNYDLSSDEMARIKLNMKKHRKYYTIFSDASRNEKIKYILVMYFYRFAKKVI